MNLTRDEIVTIAMLLSDEAAQIDIDNGYENAQATYLQSITDKLVAEYGINADDYKSVNLKARMRARSITPIEGDYIFLGHSDYGYVADGTFIINGGPHCFDELWVSMIMVDPGYEFKLLKPINDNDYAEWELINK